MLQLLPCLQKCCKMYVLCIFNFPPFSATPGKPTGPLAVSDISKNSCSLKWKPPKDDGGSKVTAYLVERQEVGKPYWTTVSSHCKVGLFDLRFFNSTLSILQHTYSGVLDLVQIFTIFFVDFSSLPSAGQKWSSY